ncbi:DNA-binding transcriptional regulator [Aeoliella sp.]|uniref:DNA-binding transcriptional regulator n=1 Tax=Aeoliella sp. TaxID=2795800 RepID=UPI003CCB7598
MGRSASEFRVAIVPDFSERYDRSVLDGVSRYVHETNRWQVYVPPDPTHRASMLAKWSGAGIIANFDDPDVMEVVRKKRVPAVGFGGGEGHRSRRVRYIATDDARIGQLGAEHLMECGLTNFGYCAMSLARRNQPWSEDRGNAFRTAVESAGYACTTFRVTEVMSSNWNLLLEALCRWLEGCSLPIGIMAAYDRQALYVLEACRELGLRVPDAVAVLGVDNDVEACELGIPPLSSIEQGGSQLGYRAAEMLDRMMRGQKVESARSVRIEPVGVVQRQSTDVLALDDPVVVAALRDIRDRACQGITVRDVVRKLSMSRVAIENRFKAALGHTMHEEIKRLQMQRVKKMLRETDLPIREIASQAGFEYPQYLSNLFQRKFKQTPGEYRQQMQGTQHTKTAAKGDHR